MNYNTEDAVNLCIRLEPVVSRHGYHLAIGGSLAYRGTSTKDIDILIYPHNSGMECGRAHLIALLKSHGFTELERNSELPATAIPDVWKSMSTNGKRVDFFFMVRSSFTNQI